MQKLITLICLLSCFCFTSLSAQCETNLVATVTECDGNGWVFTLEVQAESIDPDAGWTSPQLDATVIQPFNEPVTFGPFSTLDSVEVFLTYFGVDGCAGESILMLAPECFTGGSNSCTISYDNVATNCGIAAPGFTIDAVISTTNDNITGWISPSFGYTEPQSFGSFYSFGPFDDPSVTITVFPVGSSDCTAGSTITVNNPCDACPLGFIVQDSFPASCGQQNGIIQFQVENTQGSYEITYTGDSGQSGTLDNVTFIDGLGAGCYTLELSDETDLCTASAFICVSEVSDMNIQLGIEEGPAGAIIIAEVSGGTPPYVYEWNNGVTTAVNGPLASGVYVVTVTDSNGCTEVESVFVTSGGIELESGPSAVTNSSECGFADGSISPDVFGGVPPYEFLWSNGATTQEITGLLAGLYSLTVVDAVGNLATETYNVINDINYGVSIFTNDGLSLCEPGAEITLTALVDGSDNNPNFAYEWTNTAGVIFATTQIVTITEPGFYDVRVTRADQVGDCRAIARTRIIGGESDPDAFEFRSFAVDSLDGFCDLFIQAIYNQQGISVDWTLPSGESISAMTISAQTYGPGTYIVTVSPPQGTCPFMDTIVITPEDITCVSLYGTVFLDENDDCTTDGTEITMGSQLIQLASVADPNRVYYSFTSQDGTWNVTIPEGTYSVAALASNELFQPCAAQTITVQSGVIADPIDLGLTPLDNCPRVNVDLNIPRIRRCFDSPVYIYYENTGTAVSENTVISVEFGEWIDEVNPGFGTQPSSIVTDPITGVTTASWNIGSLDPFSGGTLNVLAYTCNNDAPVFSAACVTATVSPNSPCPPADEAWTGASVVVEGACEGDNVVFTLRNIGSGDMSVGLQYVVVEDGVIIMPNEEDDPLVAGSEFEVTLPANGSTYHLRAAQEPLHPGLLMPIDFVEGCGTGETSTGFALQFPVSDDAYWIDEDCQEIIGAYDPNDKMAEPKGYAEANYIVADQPIDYQIRFQNTGNDTAFTVIVRDTITELLDMSTFQLLSSTHDVKVSIDSSNGIAFIFEDIMLPDSFVNEPASNGAISYRILPVVDLEPGTEIENTAHIYFDFNEAIVTNTYLHTIEEDFVAVSVFDFNPVIERLTVYPNPTAGTARIQLPEAMEGEVLELDVIDALGRVMQHYNYSNGERPDANLSRLAAGWYTLRLTNGKTTVGTGRVLLEK